MSIILTVVVTVLIFGVLIALHELGHYLVARAFGVGIREYSIGMGPKLFQKQGKYNKFTLRALPIGGYVDMVGENAGDDGTAPEDEGKTPLNTKPIWQRMLIVLAGPVTNIVLGLLIMAVLVLFQSELYGTVIDGFSSGAISDDNMVYVTEDTGDFKKNDIIIAIDGKYVTAKDGLDAFLKAHKDAKEIIVIRRNSTSLLTELKDVDFAEAPISFDTEKGGFYLTDDYGDFLKGDLIQIVGKTAINAKDYNCTAEEAVASLKDSYKGKQSVAVLRIYAAMLTPTEETHEIKDLSALKFKAEDGFIKLAEGTEDILKNAIIVSVNGVAVEENETVEGFLEKHKGGEVKVKYRWYIPVQNPIIIKDAKLSDLKLNVSGALKVGDEVKAVGGYNTFVYADMSYGIFNNGVNPVDITVVRDGKKQTIKNVVFFKGNESGVLYGEIDFAPKEVKKDIGSVLYNVIFQPYSTLKMTLDNVKQTFTGRFGLEALSGPVGIGGQINEVLQAESGRASMLFTMIVMITLSLGICNLLPLPVLDGGRILLYTIEAIRRKPLNQKVEQYIMTGSMLLVLALMAFVMLKDIIKLF